MYLVWLSYGYVTAFFCLILPCQVIRTVFSLLKFRILFFYWGLRSFRRVSFNNPVCVLRKENKAFFSIDRMFYTFVIKVEFIVFCPQGSARTKSVLLVISLAGIKVCSPDGKVSSIKNAKIFQVLCCLLFYEVHADVLRFCVSYTHMAVFMSWVHSQLFRTVASRVTQI